MKEPDQRLPTATMSTGRTTGSMRIASASSTAIRAAGTREKRLVGAADTTRRARSRGWSSREPLREVAHVLLEVVREVGEVGAGDRRDTARKELADGVRVVDRHDRAEPGRGDGLLP